MAKTDTSWKQGTISPNPGGRPRKDRTPEADLRTMLKLLKKHTVEAVEKVVEVMQAADTPELKLKTATWVVDKRIAVERELERITGAKGVDDLPEEEEKPKAPVFRLTMAEPSEKN